MPTLGQDPHILMHSHIPIKRRVRWRRGFLVLVSSLEVWEHAWAHTLKWVALPLENPLIQEPPLQFSCCFACLNATLLMLAM